MRAVAKEAVLAHLDVVGNASALHRPGQRVRRVLEEAREELAAAIGAHPTSVVWTSGGSEANSIAVGGSRAARRDRPRALVSAVEHPSVLGFTEKGADVVPVTREGVVDLTELEQRLGTDVAVVSVMHVNNETGLLQPVNDVVRLATSSGAWVHTDAVQALGHVPVDFDASGVDLMTLAAHKIGGPVGIGALVARRGVEPVELGAGGGQERGIRSGTAAVALAAGFAAAATEAVAGLERETKRLKSLQDEVVRVVTGCGGVVSTLEGPHAPHVVNVTFPGARASDLLFLLDTAGIAASVGSACRAGVHQPSEVLLAMGRSEDEAASTLRFSLGHSTTADEVDVLAEVLPDLVERAGAAGRL